MRETLFFFKKNKKWLLLNVINIGLMILFIRFTRSDEVVDAEITEKCLKTVEIVGEYRVNFECN